LAQQSATAGQATGPVISRPRHAISSASLGVTRLYLAAGVALFVGFAIYFAGVLGEAVVDDAYITLTYARNLADGQGLVWAGGLRVEGYTDFLWVLLGAGAFLADLDPILVYRVAGIASGVALLGAVWAWNERYSLAPPGMRFAPLLLAAMGPVAYWAIAGLETTTFAALAFGGTLAAVNGGRGVIVSGLLFFLAALAHPDAVILMAPVAGFLLSKARREGRWRGPLLMVVTFAVPFGIYWLARWAYFGDLMPNTFYAKSGFAPTNIGQGLWYIFRFAPFAGLLAGGMIAVAWLKGLRSHAPTNVLLAQLLLWCAYLLYIGGDFMEMYRFLVPVLPALALLLQEAVSVVSARARSRARSARWATAAIAVAVAIMWVGSWYTGQYVESRMQVREEWKQLGLWFKANSDPEDVIAVTAAGAIPYFSERPAIDMLGLNDRHIAHYGRIDHSRAAAHKRYDAEYVLKQRPEFIVINNIEERGQPLLGEQFLENGIQMMPLATNDALFAQETFWDSYTRVRISALPNHNVLFVRNDRVEGQETAGLLTTVLVEERERQ
jgi:arabinofuranosyltransferase